MIGRLLVIAWKELLQLRRDRLTLAMTIALPLMQLLLFGYAVNTDVRHIKTVVYDQDGSAESRDLARSLEATGYFDLVGQVAGYSEVDRALRTGSGAALVVEPHYAADLASGRTAHVQLVLDGSDPMIVGAAADAASGLATARASKVSSDRAIRLGLAPSRPALDLALDIYYNPEQRSAVNIVPGLVWLILSLTMVMLTSMAIARERERGTLEQLIVSPGKTFEIVVGKILPYIVIGYVQMTLILFAGSIVFQVPVVGSIFFLLPNILLSGFVFPFDAMPAFARVLAQGLPLTHFIRIVRGIVLKASDFSDLARELVWMAVILAVLVSLSSLRFRKKLI